MRFLNSATEFADADGHLDFSNANSANSDSTYISVNYLQQLQFPGPPRADPSSLRAHIRTKKVVSGSALYGGGACEEEKFLVLAKSKSNGDTTATGKGVI